MAAKLYKIAKALKKGYLMVSPVHSVYIEQYGNPNGIPIVHLHGGPGAESRPRYTKFYNPEKYRIILFDQRGCGKSTPLGETRENTTQKLLQDMEQIRSYLKVDKWVLSGGSWGSTLALAYAEQFPGSVRALVLRAVFTFRQFELNWVQKEGASYFFPEAWEKYKKFIPEDEHDNIASAYAKRVLGSNTEIQKLATQKADEWARKISSIRERSLLVQKEIDEKEIASTKIFYHYEINKGFLEEGELLNNATKLAGIPGIIIQGRYDMVCPPVTAWELHKAWPDSELFFTFSGHYSTSVQSIRKMVEYTDKLAESKF